MIASEPGADLRRMSTFNMESETRKSLYSAPEIEVVKLTIESTILDASTSTGTGGGWGDGGED